MEPGKFVRIDLQKNEKMEKKMEEKKGAKKKKQY
jgi:hypothetical protein